MLFSIYEKASYALVLKASRPLAIGDKVKIPRRMRRQGAMGWLKEELYASYLRDDNAGSLLARVS